MTSSQIFQSFRPGLAWIVISAGSLSPRVGSCSRRNFFFLFLVEPCGGAALVGKKRGLPHGDCTVETLRRPCESRDHVIVLIAVWNQRNFPARSGMFENVRILKVCNELLPHRPLGPFPSHRVGARVHNRQISQYVFSLFLSIQHTHPSCIPFRTRASSHDAPFPPPFGYVDPSTSFAMLLCPPSVMFPCAAPLTHFVSSGVGGEGLLCACSWYVFYFLFLYDILTPSHIPPEQDPIHATHPLPSSATLRAHSLTVLPFPSFTPPLPSPLALLSCALRPNLPVIPSPPSSVPALSLAHSIVDTLQREARVVRDLCCSLPPTQTQDVVYCRSWFLWPPPFHLRVYDCF